MKGADHLCVIGSGTFRHYGQQRYVVFLGAVATGTVVTLFVVVESPQPRLKLTIKPHSRSSPISFFTARPSFPEGVLNHDPRMPRDPELFHYLSLSMPKLSSNAVEILVNRRQPGSPFNKNPPPCGSTALPTA